METAPPRDIHPQLLVDMTHEAHEHAMASMLIKDLQFPVDIYDVQVKRRRAARACVFVKRGGRRMPHRCRNRVSWMVISGATSRTACTRRRRRAAPPCRGRCTCRTARVTALEVSSESLVAVLCHRCRRCTSFSPCYTSTRRASFCVCVLAFARTRAWLCVCLLPLCVLAVCVLVGVCVCVCLLCVCVQASRSAS
jgi:hypothetical protein